MQPVDLLVSFDTTGSMYPCLAEVRRRVRAMTVDLFRNIPDLRIGFIAHGDYCDRGKSYVTKEMQFTRNSDDAERWVESVGRTDGGDVQECYELVLNLAHTKFAWRPDAQKVMVLIGDDVPHPSTYRLYGAPGLDWKLQADLLNAVGVRVYPVQCLNRSGRHWFYDSLAQMCIGTKLDLHQFNNAVETIMAIAYSQSSEDTLQQYAEHLQGKGLLNRGIAQTINALSRGKIAVVTSETYTTYRDGLEPVPPHRFQRLGVEKRCSIRDFVEATGAEYKAGRGFYELTKTELVQERKEVVLVDRVTGDMFTGTLARDLLGLPYGRRGKVRPGRVNHDGVSYDVFIQSTSYNRILLPNTDFLYEVKDWDR